MNTPAQKYLVDTLESFLRKYSETNSDIPAILNAGAGKNRVIERVLTESGVHFVCDRVEIEDVRVEGYGIRNCYRCSIESMHPVKSGEYNAVFANYVLEHIQHLEQCASEIYRVLNPGGIFVASIPNPTALEILLAKVTPLWFHKLLVRRDAFETHYMFKGIEDLRIIFQKGGFNTIAVYYRSCILDYFENIFILNKLARLYDNILNMLQVKRFMDNVCIVFQKPA